MKVTKSTRHSKITGDFAEALVSYWLSKYGFECARVDHTGIDLIAKNSKTKELMGISVKGRCRNTGKEGEYVSIPNENFKKMAAACKAFGCKPYLAIVVDEYNRITIFILSKKKLLRMFPKGKRVSGWKMTEKHMEEYLKDTKIYSVILTHNTVRWWTKKEK